MSDAPAAKTNEVVLLEDTEQAAECDAQQSSRAGLACYRALLAPYRWEIIINHAPGITGANDIFVPDAVKVLRRLVGDCDLGRTLLNYHTDGVAALHIGNGGLSNDQVDCVRSFERPGLILQESQGL